MTSWIPPFVDLGASRAAGRRHIGDEFLRGWIERFKPGLVLCGHIHNAPFVNNGSGVDFLSPPAMPSPHLTAAGHSAIVVA